MVDARRIADDEGRSVVSFGFFQSFYKLRFIRAHRALRHVYVAVRAGYHAEVLLLHSLAAGSEFRNRRDRSGLRSLSAGVGINFGIQHKHVYVLARSKHVIESAVADVVRPAVAADNPEGFLHKAIFRL